MDQKIADFLKKLRAAAEPGYRDFCLRYGCDPRCLGVRKPLLKKIARSAPAGDADFALALAATGIPEAVIAAGFVADPRSADRDFVEKILRDARDWAVVDSICGDFARRIPGAENFPAVWARAESPALRRAAFALVAGLASSAQTRAGIDFSRYFPEIQRAAADPDPLVWKAASWALRQIGKSSPVHFLPAKKIAENLAAGADPIARRVGREAAREFLKISPPGPDFF